MNNSTVSFAKQQNWHKMSFPPKYKNMLASRKNLDLKATYFQQEQNEYLKDITNNRVKEIILQHKNLDRTLEEYADVRNKRKIKQSIKSNLTFLQHAQQRKWLIKKGKKYLIDFDDLERKEMKQYFNSLDEKKNGSIGIDELEELLLSVGLLESREEVKMLIDSVDEDGSGKIQFGEFLSMIQNDDGQNQEIVSFFKSVIGNGRFRHSDISHSQTLKNINKLSKNITNKKLNKAGISNILQKHPYPKGLPFQMVVSHIRRKHMMTALSIGRLKKNSEQSIKAIPFLFQGDQQHENSTEQIAKGQRVMKSLQKMYQRKLIRKIKQSKKNKAFMKQVDSLRQSEMDNAASANSKLNYPRRGTSAFLDSK